MQQPPKKSGPVKKAIKFGCFTLFAFFMLLFAIVFIFGRESEEEKTKRMQEKAAQLQLDQEKAKLEVERVRLETEKAKAEADRLEKERIANETPEEREERLFADFKKELTKLSSIEELDLKKESYRGNPETVEYFNAVVDRIEALKQHEQDRAKEQLKSHFSLWDGSCRPLERQVKKNLNDPDSYDHDKTGYKFITARNAMYVETRFRANNKFGAKVITYASCYLNPDGSIENFQFRERPRMEY